MLLDFFQEIPMNRTMIALLLVAALGLFAISTRAQETPAADNADAKRADVRKLLEVSGTGAMGKQAADQMITQFPHFDAQRAADVLG
jgi:hypothetical protein